MTRDNTCGLAAHHNPNPAPPHAAVCRMKLLPPGFFLQLSSCCSGPCSRQGQATAHNSHLTGSLWSKGEYEKLVFLGCRGRWVGRFHQYLWVYPLAMVATSGVHSRLSAGRLAGNTWAHRGIQPRTGTAGRQAYTEIARNMSLGIK